LTGWAVYKQTQTTQVTDKGRFKMAIIYAAVGACVGGFAMPHGAAAYGLLLAGLALSAVVGEVRGRLTTMWRDAKGLVWRRGNVATVSLFLALVAGKFVLGTIAYVAHIHDGAGFGEVLVMIAIMIAVQAEIIHRRASALMRAASNESSRV
jgi:hypothetical protein